MKTLHMTNAWHGDSGGVATFYRALAASAGENDHSIRLIVPAAVDRVEDVNPWARIYHLRSPKAPFSSNYRLLLPHRLMLPGSAGHTILRNERPDLIEVCDKYSLHYVAAAQKRLAAESRLPSGDRGHQLRAHGYHGACLCRPVTNASNLGAMVHEMAVLPVLRSSHHSLRTHVGGTP